MPTSFADLFSSDENIWAIGLLVLGAAFVVVMLKALFFFVARKLRKQTGETR